MQSILPRACPLICVSLCLALAGCASDDTVQPLVNDVPEEPVVAYAIPADILDSGLLPVGVHSLCISRSCPTYDFELFGNTSVDVRLTWHVPANDIDFYVFNEDDELVMEGANIAPQTLEHAVAKLAAGPYSITIQPWQAATDEYTIHVTFARP